MRSRRLFSAAATVLALILTTSTLGAISATASEQHYGRYVALGDSYTSGPLIPGLRLDPIGCTRSTANYPALLAERLKVDEYIDVSCGGADTGDMTMPQPIAFGQNAPQLNALRPDTDLATVSIGGNDYAVFGRMVTTCPTLRASNPTGAPCQDLFTEDGVDLLKADLEKTRANVTEVLAEVRHRAPDAEVLAIGYPRILPDEGYCPDVMPFADGDYAWIASVEESLNAAMREAAAATGTTFVDMYPASEGHDGCAGQGAAWINGKDHNLFAAMSYHPFRSGMEGVADVTARTLGH